jgi:hypothetical protein
MKSFLKDFNDNFWKYMVVIVLIIMLSFSIKWTNCLCSFSDAAVRYFDRNGPNEHFTVEHGVFDKVKDEVTKATREAKSETNKAKEKTEKIKEQTQSKVTAIKAQAAEKVATVNENKMLDEAKKQADASVATAKKQATTTVADTESAASKAATDAKKQATTTVSAAKSAASKAATDAKKQVTTTASAAKSATATKPDNENNQLAKEEEALLESFTSKVRTCEIKSPNNIVAGYMNSIDHDINNACNHPNPNECSLVKSSVTGGVQYIEARSLRKSHGEFSGVTEWTKQTA